MLCPPAPSPCARALPTRSTESRGPGLPQPVSSVPWARVRYCFPVTQPGSTCVSRPMSARPCASPGNTKAKGHPCLQVSHSLEEETHRASQGPRDLFCDTVSRRKLWGPRIHELVLPGRQESTWPLSEGTGRRRENTAKQTRSCCL